jgi:cell surface protein SprA
VLEIDFQGARYPGQGFAASEAWAGLMRLIASSGRDYSGLAYLEVWLRQKRGSGGEMHVDFGEISENFYNPWTDSLHTEDRNANGRLDSDENTGLDGVFSGQPGDDPYDDWAFAEGDYSRINGTEDNPRTVPDTEDLDGDGELDQDESRFRLTFDLDDTTYVASKSDDWRLYRIPMAEAEAFGGSPSWDAISSVRFFFTGADSGTVYQIAFLELRGCTWENEGVRPYWDMSPVSTTPDEEFRVSAKNTRDNPDYAPPYDPGRDAQGYRKREQSMAMEIRVEGHAYCGAVHRRLDSASDLSLYESLAFYVHGDQNSHDAALYAFVRFGADSLNFYEYCTRILPGWRSIEVALDDFRAVERHSPIERTLYGQPVAVRATETAGGWIWIFGEPAFADVTWLGAGLFVLAQVGGAWPLEVWLDNLRVTSTR